MVRWFVLVQQKEILSLIKGYCKVNRIVKDLSVIFFAVDIAGITSKSTN